MGIQFNFDTAAAIDFVDGLLMDVARRVQVPPSKHEEAIAHYTGLCEHVDRSGSPLEDKVLENYPSGSFSIHAAIYTKVKSLQHDVDVVVEVDVPLGTDPEWMLNTLFAAIKGEPGSKYYDFPIERNSRCITVKYPDGVTVDLMPVVRIPFGPERSGNLFHHKRENDEKLRKEVNPKAFTNHFNMRIASSDTFAAKFRSRRFLVDGLLVDKAETQPMPGHLPLEEKSPRLVAIQLLKRFRDVQYRSEARKNTRKPPSVVIAAVALDAGPMTDSLYDELCAISLEFCNRIEIAEINETTLVVTNPAHGADEFTDRWPEDRRSQLVWKRDLNNLIMTLRRLKTSNFDGSDVKRELTNLFGETVADRAIEEHYRGQAEVAKRNRLGVSKSGSIVPVLASPAIATGLVVPVRANTNMGGSIEDLDD